MRNISFERLRIIMTLSHHLIDLLSDYCKRFELDFPSPSHNQKNLTKANGTGCFISQISSGVFETLLFHNVLVAPRSTTMAQLAFARRCATLVTAASNKRLCDSVASSPYFPKFHFAIQLCRAPSSYSVEVQLAM